MLFPPPPSLSKSYWIESEPTSQFFQPASTSEEYPHASSERLIRAPTPRSIRTRRAITREAPRTIGTRTTTGPAYAPLRSTSEHIGSEHRSTSDQSKRTYTPWIGAHAPIVTEITRRNPAKCYPRFEDSGLNGNGPAPTGLFTAQ